MSANTEGHRGLSRSPAFCVTNIQVFLRPDTDTEVEALNAALFNTCMRSEEEGGALLTSLRGTPLLSKFRARHAYDTMIERMLGEASHADRFVKALSFIRLLESEGFTSEYSQLSLLACLQKLGMQTELKRELQNSGYPLSQLQEVIDRLRAGSSNPVMLELFEQLDLHLVQLFQQEQTAVADATKI